MLSQDPTQQPKFRSSCDACQEAKVKCSKEPACRRCVRHKIPCVYSPLRRIGRPRKNRSQSIVTPDNAQSSSSGLHGDGHESNSYASQPHVYASSGENRSHPPPISQGTPADGSMPVGTSTSSYEAFSAEPAFSSAAFSDAANFSGFPAMDTSSSYNADLYPQNQIPNGSTADLLNSLYVPPSEVSGVSAQDALAQDAVGTMSSIYSSMITPTSSVNPFLGASTVGSVPLVFDNFSTAMRASLEGAEDILGQGLAASNWEYLVSRSRDSYLMDGILPTATSVLNDPALSSMLGPSPSAELSPRCPVNCNAIVTQQLSFLSNYMPNGVTASIETILQLERNARTTRERLLSCGFCFHNRSVLLLLSVLVEHFVAILERKFKTIRDTVIAPRQLCQNYAATQGESPDLALIKKENSKEISFLMEIGRTVLDEGTRLRFVKHFLRDAVQKFYTMFADLHERLSAFPSNGDYITAKGIVADAFHRLENLTNKVKAWD